MIVEVDSTYLAPDSEAACVGHHVLFEPDDTEQLTDAQVSAAGILCGTCPALKACTRYAEEHYELERTRRRDQTPIFIAGRVRYDKRIFGAGRWAAELNRERDRRRQIEASIGDPAAIYKEWKNRRISKYEKLSENRQVVA